MLKCGNDLRLNDHGSVATLSTDTAFKESIEVVEQAFNSKSSQNFRGMHQVFVLLPKYYFMLYVCVQFLHIHSRFRLDFNSRSEFQWNY